MRLYRNLLIGLCILLIQGAQAAPDADDFTSQVEVPKGVKYQEPDEGRMERAGQFLRTVLTPNYKGPDRLFGKTVICFPYLWSELKDQASFANLPGGVVHVSANVDGQALNLEGKLLQTADSTAALETLLRSWLSQDGAFHIRKLTSPELAAYWALISFELTDPVFVVESKNHQLLFQFAKGTSIMLVDDLRAHAPDTPRLLTPAGQGSAMLKEIHLLTPDADMRRAIATDVLVGYIKALQAAVLQELERYSATSSQTLIVRIELSPGQDPTIRVGHGPGVDPSVVERVGKRVAQVSAPSVKGPAGFEMRFAIPSGSGFPPLQR